MARRFANAIVESCPNTSVIIPVLVAVKGNAMLNKKCLGAVILAATAVTSTAMADDRGVNTAVGAVLGAAIGHNTGGRGGAIVGGVIGAALGNAVSTNDRGYNQGGRGYYQER